MSFGTQNFRPITGLNIFACWGLYSLNSQNRIPPRRFYCVSSATLLHLYCDFSSAAVVAPVRRPLRPGGPPGGCHTAPEDTWKDISHKPARFLFIPFVGSCRAVVMTTYIFMRLCTASSLQRQEAGREPLPHLSPAYPKTSFRFL